MQPMFKRLLPILLALALAGCAPQILTPTQPVQADPRIEQAQLLFEQQLYLEAAGLYAQLAESLPQGQRDGMRLMAAEAYLKAEQPDQAEQMLLRVDSTRLAAGASQQQRLLLAELALQRNHPNRALELLQPPLDPQSDLTQQVRYHQLRAEALRLAGNLLEAARERQLVDDLLEDAQLRLENQQLILETLTDLTDTALELLQPDPPGVQGGWMELARIIKSFDGDSAAIEPRIEGWRERFPDHPALPGLLENYLARIASQYQKVEHLAVMLPASGRYAKAAIAIRNGLMAAYYQQPVEKRPVLRFYDSSNAADVWPLLLQAAEEGADLVIGPLQKSAVSQLARAGELPVAVMALNQVTLEVAPPENFYQFSLAPEDEAKQVAERAWLDGYTRGLALVPDDSWGERVFAAFRDRWERLGGQLVASARYDATQVDFSNPIRGMLNLDQSESRQRNLQRLLGEKLEFEPRRRQDLDFILLAANVEKGRQIRPQLQFHRAADLPVFATSRVYSGLPDSKADIDLEGVRFPDMPWLLEETGSDPLSRERLGELLPESRSLYRRLYAMGMDAYRLPAHLLRLGQSPSERFEGRSGQLSLDNLRRVHRQLLWAEMKAGLPQVIGYAPRMSDDEEQSLAPLPQALPLPGSAEPGARVETEQPPESEQEPPVEPQPAATR